MTQRHCVQNEAVMLITTNTIHRKPFFAKDVNARETIETLYRVQELHPFYLYGFVIMPDHCHFLMKVLEPETISKVMNVFKSGVTFNLGIPKIWQSRFHMRIPKNLEGALHYIHRNPVKAGLVPEPDAYPWSSASGKWDVVELGVW